MYTIHYEDFFILAFIAGVVVFFVRSRRPDVIKARQEREDAAVAADKEMEASIVEAKKDGNYHMLNRIHGTLKAIYWALLSIAGMFALTFIIPHCT